MRPRERYTLAGPDGFGDAELVALILGTGLPGRSARSVAQALLDDAGGLAGLVVQPVGALSRVAGVGPARAVRIHAALSLGRRALAAADPPADPVRCDVDAVRWFTPRLAALPHEELHGLLLDRRQRVRGYRVLTRGTDGHTIVDPRQVLREALLAGAAGVIVAHNHPSGDPTPSAADVEVTIRLEEAARLVGVDLVDHIVIAGANWRSLRGEGLLKKPHALPVLTARAWA
ncbi:MAG: DNA repair protein RadC [Deltaproteobacteria bacterium]|nr:DNA repair protein RadC [Deltaproteobacteria bacterium]